jgi:hypothetical protein
MELTVIMAAVARVSPRMAQFSPVASVAVAIAAKTEKMDWVAAVALSPQELGKVEEEGMGELWCDIRSTNCRATGNKQDRF